ncbi:hypothetical protein CBW65_04960 [Tumebacillus avium]|uniref:Uncharacterized protein n=1 Tax=Tumebacillus avium TaxID=1903704 RepID=A0A1Y0ILU0_9BACL|nr:hypothetical protein [Tumebacillus avium]ARU60495.1 hypothetical protein CBW65_04960 [Tumebacillus avium]
MSKGLKKMLLMATAPITEQGFSLDPKRSGANMWTYSKQMGNLTQYIVFDKSGHRHQAVRVFLETSRDPVGIYGATLSGREDIWWYYTDEENLKEVLAEMVQLIVDKGLSWFEISAKGVPKPTDEIARSVLDNLTERVKRFEYDHQLDHTNPDTVAALEKVIRSKEDESLEVDWDFLCDAAAYFGELLRCKFGGSWGSDEDYGWVIQLMNGTKKIRPLNQVAMYWNNPYRGLQGTFHLLCNTLLN